MMETGKLRNIALRLRVFFFFGYFYTSLIIKLRSIGIHVPFFYSKNVLINELIQHVHLFSN